VRAVKPQGAQRCALLALSLCACAPSPPWLPEPPAAPALTAASAALPPAPPPRPTESQHIRGEPDPLAERKQAVARGDAGIGRRVGVFRNTYYDFPEARDFHDTLCMQGSGLLSDGRTLSFARRDCKCARVCPRSGQRICFEALAPEQFPWGRGASGDPVTPLLTVAVDIAVIPLGTSLFIPEYVGLPREPGNGMEHDGCFLAQDRGIKIQGQHIDVFTGAPTLTQVWNQLVPSNRGVTVIVDSPFCPPVTAVKG
jgi:3D (Asp-Asp-Asp) domain-containing protein